MTAPGAEGGMMMAKILWMIAAICLAGCTNDSQAIRVLEGQGYTEIELDGYGWFDCSEDDEVHNSFRAFGPTGVAVEGTVCCGLIVKDCTVRTQ